MKEIVDLFRMLADETRLRIMILLAQDDLCVCQLCGILSLSQPKVSRHLAKLRDMGFVLDKRRERFVFYSLNRQNQIVTSLEKLLLEQIEISQQLRTDSIRLTDKNTFLSQCGSAGEITA